jgi:hypothetical protein
MNQAGVTGVGRPLQAFTKMVSGADIHFQFSIPEAIPAGETRHSGM